LPSASENIFPVSKIYVVLRENACSFLPYLQTKCSSRNVKIQDGSSSRSTTQDDVEMRLSSVQGVRTHARAHTKEKRKTVRIPEAPK
jgi:hypothetical protein